MVVVVVVVVMVVAAMAQVRDIVMVVVLVVMMMMVLVGEALQVSILSRETGKGNIIFGYEGHNMPHILVMVMMVVVLLP